MEDNGSRDPEAACKATLQDVYKAIDDLGSPGVTCTGGEAKGLPALPGLHIEGVGQIPLPLNQDIAEKLKKVSHQAPHGRGMETLIDTSVRNTLQINADQVTLTNPSWAPCRGDSGISPDDSASNISLTMRIS